MKCRLPLTLLRFFPFIMKHTRSTVVRVSHYLSPKMGSEDFWGSHGFQGEGEGISRHQQSIEEVRKKVDCKLNANDKEIIKILQSLRGGIR